jgi:hypothetical protein
MAQELVDRAAGGVMIRTFRWAGAMIVGSSPAEAPGMSLGGVVRGRLIDGRRLARFDEVAEAHARRHEQRHHHRQENCGADHGTPIGAG